MDRQEWLAKRRQCVTGTDVARIVGISKWGGPLDVYAEKLGLVEDKEPTEYMEWGNRLEALIAEKYAEVTGVEVKKGEFLQDDIFGGTPDYLWTNGLGGLECKTASSFMKAEWGAEHTDEIPQAYFIQCQWYMHLTGVDRWDVAVLFDGRKFAIYNLEYRPMLVNELLKRARAFWNDHVVPQIPPKAAGSSEAINAIFRREFENIENVDAENDIVNAISNLIVLKSEIKHLEKRQENLENIIKARIGRSSGVFCAAGTATWKEPKPRQVIDYKGIIAECKIPRQIIEKHTTLVDSSRRFLIKTT